MKISLVEVKIEGIYFWGDGWDTRTREEWNKYFRGGMLDENGNEPIHWHFCEGSMDSQYLVGICGGAMIHPMEMSVAIRHIGSNSVKHEVEELYEIFNRIVTKLGGQVYITEKEVEVQS